MCIIYGNTQMNTNYKLYKCIEHTSTTKHTNISYKTSWECNISKGSFAILHTFENILICMNISIYIAMYVYKYIYTYVCIYLYLFVCM